MRQHILIDDDSLIQISWKFKALKTGVTLSIFSSVKEFILNSSDFPNDSLIYIDSDLKNGEKGEIEAEKIFKLGFTTIYLSTGYEDLDITTFPWLTRTVGKQPPF